MTDFKFMTVDDFDDEGIGFGAMHTAIRVANNKFNDEFVVLEIKTDMEVFNEDVKPNPCAHRIVAHSHGGTFSCHSCGDELVPGGGWVSK